MMTGIRPERQQVKNVADFVLVNSSIKMERGGGGIKHTTNSLNDAIAAGYPKIVSPKSVKRKREYLFLKNDGVKSTS